jgi:hypothetical protein
MLIGNVLGGIDIFVPIDVSKSSQKQLTSVHQLTLLIEVCTDVPAVFGSLPHQTKKRDRECNGWSSRQAENTLDTWVKPRHRSQIVGNQEVRNYDLDLSISAIC